MVTIMTIEEKHQLRLKKLVVEEAKALRKYATDEERSRLDYETSKVYNAASCIYGQMTGSCYNERASELISQCNEKFFSNSLHSFYDPLLSEAPLYIPDMRSYSPIVLGKLRTEYGGYTPIEVYITGPSNRLYLMSYIKGKHDTLTVDDL